MNISAVSVFTTADGRIPYAKIGKSLIEVMRRPQ